jgi:hypothetical protein
MDKPTVLDVLPSLRVYLQRPENGAGGPLHIVVEDGNYHDDHLWHCLRRAEELGDEDGVWLAKMMLRMSKTQRKKLCFKAHYEK